MKRRLKRLIDNQIARLDSLKERLEDISSSLSPPPPPLPEHFKADYGKIWEHRRDMHKDRKHIEGFRP